MSKQSSEKSLEEQVEFLNKQGNTLVKDHVTLAKHALVVIEHAMHDGSMLEQANLVKHMCKHVLDAWVQKEEDSEEA